MQKIVQPGMNFEYEYDSRGNIVSEIRNGAETKYEYDTIGQLVYVSDPHDTECSEHARCDSMITISAETFWRRESTHETKTELRVRM